MRSTGSPSVACSAGVGILDAEAATARTEGSAATEFVPVKLVGDRPPTPPRGGRCGADPGIGRWGAARDRDGMSGRDPEAGSRSRAGVRMIALDARQSPRWGSRSGIARRLAFFSQRRLLRVSTVARPGGPRKHRSVSEVFDDEQVVRGDESEDGENDFHHVGAPGRGIL